MWVGMTCLFKNCPQTDCELEYGCFLCLKSDARKSPAYFEDSKLSLQVEGQSSKYSLFSLVHNPLKLGIILFILDTSFLNRAEEMLRSQIILPFSC